MSLHAQQIKDFQGKVVAQGKDVTGVVVRNINSQKATITDENGDFEIPVKQNDTLIFLAVQFKNKIIPITSEIFKTNFITVPLEEFVNELDEVVVSPYNLSGDIDKDIENLKLEKDVSAETLALPNANKRIVTQSERKLQQATSTQTTGAGIVALTPILNAITGRTKMLKKRLAIDKKYGQTQTTQESFELLFFTQTLRIPKEKIHDFMYYCEVDSTFEGIVETNDQLKMWEFLRMKSLEYRHNNGLYEK